MLKSSEKKYQQLKVLLKAEGGKRKTLKGEFNEVNVKGFLGN